MRAALLCLLLAVATPLSSHASGSFLPSAESGRPAVDRSLYEIGKAVCKGEAPLASFDPSRKDSQLEALRTIHSRLPAKIRARLDLESKAGYLSERQMDAVLHFIQVRFRVRL